ncbi:MAG: PQQ-dependent dehydrogenase, methanol/ethanol family [Rhizomicrobium sp.]
MKTASGKCWALSGALLAILSVRVAADDLDAMSRDDKQWIMPAKNYSANRFSGLNQINAGNAGQLRVAWTFSLGSSHGQEAAPLIVNGTMYVVGPYPNELFALDAVTGDLKWKYTPNTDPASQGEACCDVVNRGAAYDNGKIFYNTLDNHTVAVDAKTGKEVWAVKLGEISRGETMTMAPLVAKGKVLVGNSGGEMGVRGWLTALDENTGKIAWRAYSTGPDKDVLIGPKFHPLYNWEKGKDLGVKSWPPGKWKIGGGTVWGWIAFDPNLNLIYYGTGNPGPWNSNQRPGDNMWTTAVFARDVDTGQAVWADQLGPHDLWDYDEINESILLDMNIGGKQRHVLLRPGRNGFMYVIDRTNGQILSADKYDTVTSATGVNLKNGRYQPVMSLAPTLGKTVQNVCPAAPGAKDWQPTAYSPVTHLLYIPHQHLCMDFKTSEVGYIAGTPYVGATVDMYGGPGGYRGEFAAWDPVKRKKVWALKENLPVWSGTLVTAGNVAFYGTMDRWFKAVDARNGKLLYKFHGPSGFVGQPVTYQGSDGTQYVAILSGIGGWAGAVGNAEIDPRVRAGALGFNGATQDVPQYTSGGSALLVFSLPRKPPQNKPQGHPNAKPH